MISEKVRMGLTGAVLAVLVSVGAVGCLLTGFGLNLEKPGVLWLMCCVTAVLCSGLFQWKWGSAAVLGLMALWAGWLWQRGEAGEQILQLISRISRVYDLAYGWGQLKLTELSWDAGYADLPLQLLGCGIGAAVSHTVCRGKWTWPAVGFGAAPLVLCLVVTNTVPREKFLFCLLTGLTLLILSASVRRLETDQAGRLIRLLAVPVALGMGLLFWAIPQEGYVNQSAEVREKILTWVEELPEKVEDTARELASAAPGSNEETVNLKTLGRQSNLAYPVMDVTSDWGGALYLRERDYDSYTGTGWTATPHRAEEFAYAGEKAGSVQIETRSRRDNLFLPYYPADAAQLVGGSLDNPDRARAYTLERRVLPEDWRSLVQQRAQGIWESDVVFTAALNAAKYLDSARYLLLPSETESRAKELLETILPGEGTATENADRIAAYVRSSARYDRDMERMPTDEEDFALWFLEDSDRGYCVHFATATVVLLRAAEIPARYVTGYLAHCSPGETVTVTADTAHAWAEYYESQLACWIPLEATPAEGLTPGTVPEVETEPTARPQQPTAPEQTEPTFRYPIAQEQMPQTQVTRPGSKKVSFAWLWLLLLPAAAVAQVPARIALRRRALQGGPNRRALGYWREILLLARLQRKPAPKAMEKLAQKAKFSQHTLTEQELEQMQSCISDSVEQLKQRPWYLRLLYRLVYAAW